MASGSRGVPTDQADWNADRSFADFHQPHILTAFGTYELPFARGSHLDLLNYIATTSTRTGLQVTSQPNTKQYKTGIRISDEQMATINITPNQHIPKWNYTISPSPN